jgi:tellurite resistance protein TerC
MIPWITFGAVVAGALALDIGVLQRRERDVSLRQALGWMAGWIGLAVVFNIAIYFWYGPQHALEYATAYLVEEALSVDNMFVFYVIFGYFAVPAHQQRRVLFWGIVGAMIMRGIFIAVGVALLERFHWLIYIFGAFLVVTGLRLLKAEGAQVEPEKNPLIHLFRKWVPMVNAYHGKLFTVRLEGKRYATPLLLVLVLVEATDLMFALDSIPAVLAISTHPFIVYTSNVFAILGLRALYFVLAGLIGTFRHLHYGLAFVLAFIGVKMLISSHVEIPTLLSLGVVVGAIGLSILASVLRPPSNPPTA